MSRFAHLGTIVAILASLTLATGMAVTPAAAADVETGVITGVISSFSGDVAPHGQVYAESAAPFGQGRSAVIAGDGTFTFPPLLAGDYRVYVELSDPGAAGGTWWPGAPDRARAQLVHVERGGITDASWRLAAPPADIIGSVIDGVTGEGVPNVWITLKSSAVLNRPHAVTGADGGFRFHAVTSGHYTLENDRTLEGRYPERTDGAGWPIDVPDTGTVAPVLRLTPNGRIVGTLSGMSTEMGGILEIYRSGETNSARMLTGLSDGRFESGYLAPGDYLLHVIPFGDGVSEWWSNAPTRVDATPVHVSAGEDSTVDWSIRTGGIVTGVVTDAETGDPVAGLDVGLSPYGNELGTAVTDASGRYRLAGLPAGDYPLIIEGRDHSTSSTPFHVTLGETVQLDVAVHRVGQLEASALWDGPSEASVLVEVYDEDLELIAHATPRAEGGFHVDRLDAGTYFVRFLKGRSAYVPTWYGGSATPEKSTPVHVEPGRLTSIMQRITPADEDVGVVRGRVIAADTGAGLDKVTVRLRDSSGASNLAVTDSYGAFAFEPLRQGAVVLEIASPVPGYALPAPQSKTFSLMSATRVDFTIGRVLSSSRPALPSAVRVGVLVRPTVALWQEGSTLTYQWRRNGAPIAGAVRADYAPTAADRGSSLTLTVTGTKPGHATTSQTSVGRIVGYGIISTSAPKITGTTKVRRTLAVSRGAWTSGTTFSYQWYRNGSKIAGATKSSYRPTWRDAGKKLTVKVTGKKAGYTTVARVSAPTKKIRR